MTIEEMAKPGRAGRLPAWALPPPGPSRTLALATLVNTLGNGAFVSVGTIYFVRSVGLSVTSVGLGFTLAGALALLAGIPLGQLADRVGPRTLFSALCLVQGTAVAAYALVGSWTTFTLAACVAITADRSTASTRNAYIARLFPGGERVRTRAYLRSVNNAGLSVGALAGGLALTVDTRPVYIAVLLADAGTFFLTAFLVARMPAGAAVRSSEPSRWAATGKRRSPLRDVPFMVVVVSQAVLALHYEILEIALPLWIATRTDLPRGLIPVALVTTTVGSILLQVKASRGTDTVAGAARAARRAGWLLAAACGLFAWTGDLGGAEAIVVLLLAVLVRLAGELFQAASSWGVSFGMSPPDSAGAYQAVFSSGYSTMTMIAPLLCALLVRAPGPSGWAVAGIGFIVAGQVCFRAAGQRWTSRSRTGTSPGKPPAQAQP